MVHNNNKKNFYDNLLNRRQKINEKSIHNENVETVLRGMAILNDVTEPIEITKKEMEEIVSSLKNKKADNRCGRDEIMSW